MPTQPSPHPHKPRRPVPAEAAAPRPKPRQPGLGKPAAPRREPHRPVSGPGSSHFPNRTSWSRAVTAGRSALAAGAAVVRAAGRSGLAAATGEVGRRVGRAAALIVTLAVVVVVLYDRGEVPVAAAKPALAAPGARPAAGPGAARRADPGDRGGLRGRARPAPVGERPAAVAAAWYAARSGVPRARVKPLQQDRLSATEVRVLVLADHGHGRLRTTLVRLRLGPDGWSVR
jgi:hypothetical protein